MCFSESLYGCNVYERVLWSKTVFMGWMRYIRGGCSGVILNLNSWVKLFEFCTKHYIMWKGMHFPLFLNSKRLLSLFRLSPGIDTLVKKLHENNKAVYLVSGGFRQMINVSKLLVLEFIHTSLLLSSIFLKAWAKIWSIKSLWSLSLQSLEYHLRTYLPIKSYLKALGNFRALILMSRLQEVEGKLLLFNRLGRSDYDLTFPGFNRSFLNPSWKLKLSPSIHRLEVSSP